MVPALMTAAGASAAGWSVAPSVFAYLALWYAAEIALAAGCGWPIAWQTLPAMLTRDLMMPFVWVGAFTGRSFTWKGTAMRMEAPRGRKSAEPIPLRPKDGLS